MTKLQRMLTAAALTLALSLTGCMGRKQPEQAPERQEEKGGAKKKQKDPIEQGAGEMQSQLADLRAALKAGDTGEAKKQARELDDTWEGFERKVEQRSPDMYRQVELPLNALLAAVQVAPIDNTAVQKAIDSLDVRLGQLKETRGKPAKPEKVDMKTGAAAMRHDLSEVKKAAERGDTAQVQQKAEAADQTWNRFEEAVKQSKETYEKIEDGLHALLDAANKSPMDPKKVTEQADKLDQLLAELEQ